MQMYTHYIGTHLFLRLLPVPGVSIFLMYMYTYVVCMHACMYLCMYVYTHLFLRLLPVPGVSDLIESMLDLRRMRRGHEYTRTHTHTQTQATDSKTDTTQTQIQTRIYTHTKSYYLHVRNISPYIYTYCSVCTVLRITTSHYSLVHYTSPVRVGRFKNDLTTDSNASVFVREQTSSCVCVRVCVCVCV